MEELATKSEAITAQPCAGVAKTQFLCEHADEFGLSCEVGSMPWWAYRLAPAYRGSRWFLYLLSNGGAFLAPAGCGPLGLRRPGTGDEGLPLLSEQAAGVVLSLVSIAWWRKARPECAKLCTLFDNLMAYAVQHEEFARMRQLLHPAERLTDM